MSAQPGLDELTKRLESLEQRLQQTAFVPPQAAFHPAWPLTLGIAAVVLGYLTVGAPRHYYQLLFSVLLLLLLYHRGKLLYLEGKWKWPGILVNFALLCLVFQFLIGGGISHPFDWIKLPVLHDVPAVTEKSWYSALVPDWKVQWEAIPAIAQWELDITKIQTFLLLTVLAGASFRFEPFTSIAALSLILFSLPAYLRINWDWLVPFVTAASVNFYLQTVLSSAKRADGRERRTLHP